jgi:hypothetical protein
MPQEPVPKRQEAPTTPRAQRPVAEPETLTITVADPAVQQDVGARIPHHPLRIPPYVEWPRVPRAYWVLLASAAVLLYLSYKAEYAAFIRYLEKHRLLPARVVRVERAIERRLPGSGTAGEDSTVKHGSEPK